MLLLAMLLTGPAAADDVVDQGRALFVAKCQACHGSGGQGDGPAARALPKKLKDFTSAEFWETMDEEKLRTTIRQGKPGSSMRGFPMAEDRLEALVTYLLTLAPEG